MNDAKNMLQVNAVLITPHYVFAQIDPNNDCSLSLDGCLLPDDPGGSPDAQAPFDGGLTILLVAGVAAAIKRRKGVLTKLDNQRTKP